MRLLILALTTFVAAPALAQPCTTVQPLLHSNSTFTAAPTYAEEAHAMMLTTAPQALHRLANGDKEFILHCGSPDEAARLFAAIKDKPDDFPNALVIAAGQDGIAVAFSDEAKRTHKADYIFHTSAPFSWIPQAGSLVDISGTYTSYLSEPILLVMDNTAVKPARAFPLPRHISTYRGSQPRPIAPCDASPATAHLCQPLLISPVPIATPK